MDDNTRRDRVRRLGELAGDAKAGYTGYRRVRRLAIGATGVALGLLAIVAVAGGDDEDDDRAVTGPVPVQVEDDDDD